MKVKTFLSIPILLLIVTQSLQAQILFRSEGIKDLIDILDWVNRNESKEFEYEGSPYQYDEFKPGIIYYDGKFKYEDVPLRYNIFNDEIEFEFKSRNLVYACSPEFSINKVVIEEDSFVVRKYEKEKNAVVPGFFKLLADGEASLLVKMEVDYMEPQAATAFLDAEPAKFINRPDDYYFSPDGENAYRIKKIKKVCDQLEGNKKELLEFIKQEKISSRNEEELIRFFNYYNSL